MSRIDDNFEQTVDAGRAFDPGMSRRLVVALGGLAACVLVFVVVGLAACGRKPLALQYQAAEALDCPRDEIVFDSYDDDEGGATAICRNRGVYLERAGNQWLVMQSFAIDAAQ